MADKKISQMALLSAVDLDAAVDYLPIVDPSEPAAADQNKRILVSSILTNAVDEGTILDQSYIGTAPNEIPLNANLGGMAYQSPESVVIRPQATAVPNGIGDMIFQATSDSVIEMEYKGSDAIVRTAQIPLSNERLVEISRVTPLAQAVRVAMTAAASGSNGIQVLDNADLDMGTNDFTLHWEGSLPDWTPSTGAQDLIYKFASSVGYRLIIGSTALGFPIVSINGTLFTASIVNNIANGSVAKITAVIVRQAASVDGSVTFYINGAQHGTAVVIPAGVPATVNNSVSAYISGNNTERFASDTQQAIIYNRALSAAEVLSLSVNGPALADIGASQTNLITGDSSNFEGGTVGSWAANTGNGVTSVAVNTVSPISGTYDLLTVTNGLTNSGIQLNIGSVVAGEKYRLVFDYKGATSNAWSIIFRNNANPASGSVWADTVVGGTGWQPATAGQFVYEFTCSLTTASGRVHIVNSVVDTIQLDNFVLVNLGITGQWNAADAQSNTGQIFDSSGNKNHALLPAAGATIIGRPTSQQQQVRWTNTWAGTNELQYIGGVNQAILPANAYIESIVGTVSGATPHDIIIGDGSDTDRYVTITTGLATGTTSFTLANRTTDGTNLKLTVDPDTDATMSIAWVISYTTLE